MSAVVDPELIPPLLDLSRPELEAVRERYLPPTVLLVRSSPVMKSLAHEFAGRGWRVTACSGPHTAGCPVARDGVCGLRSTADVAVVEMEPPDPAADDPLDLLRCGVAEESPGLLLFERHALVVGGHEAPRRIELKGTPDILSATADLARDD